MFNYAVYAANEAKANARAAVVIKLDGQGNPTNTRPTGQPFTMSEVIAAQEQQSYAAYQGAMSFLDAIIGDDADTATRKAFDRAKAKFASVEHATEMRDKLMTAALNGSNAALIAYAAASIFINSYASVDFSWFVNGSDELLATTDHEGYVTAPVIGVTVSIAYPAADQIDDYEGFAVTYRPAGADVAVTPTPTTPQKPPTVAPAKPAPIAQPAPAQPMTLVHSHGSELVRTATGWQAESASSPGSFHHTSKDGSTCTCAGFRGRYRKCWHTATVRAYVAELVTAGPAGPAGPAGQEVMKRKIEIEHGKVLDTVANVCQVDVKRKLKAVVIDAEPVTDDLPAWCKRFDNRVITPPSQHIGVIDLLGSAGPGPAGPAGPSGPLGPKDAVITVMGDCVIVRRADRKVRYHYPAQMSGASCRRVLDLLEKCRQGEWANRFYWEGGANEA